MPLTRRHVMGSPLLLAGLAFAWALAVSLQDPRCEAERAGWIANNLVLGTFVAYFGGTYFAVLARRYLAAGIATLWAWHLLMFWPSLDTHCEDAKRQALLRESLGFGLPELVIAVAIAGLLGSLALAWRYRHAEQRPLPDRARSLLRVLVLLTGAAAVVWLALSFTGAMLRDAYGRLGSDLPEPTLLFLSAYPYSAVLPIACLAPVLVIRGAGTPDERRTRWGLDGAAALAVLLNVVLSAAAFAVLAPARSLCSCL